MLILSLETQSPLAMDRRLCQVAWVLVVTSQMSCGWLTLSCKMTAGRPRPPSVRRSLEMKGMDCMDTPTPDVAKRVVMKFGGSSLASAERIHEVASIVAARAAAGPLPAVVVSAMGKTTNMLNSAAEHALAGEVDVSEVRNLHLETLEALGAPASVGMEVRSLLRDLESVLDGVSMVRELTSRTCDLVSSFGERMSCRIVAAALRSMDVPATPRDAWTLGLRTQGDFGEAVVNEASYPDIARSLAEPLLEVPIITGFIGHDADGRVTTLGRGGSDLTATAIAAAAGFDEVQVWKDVDGMLTADPRVVPTAQLVPFVTYEEAAELAFFGAQVLHPVSMQPARKANIPVRVKNSYNPDHPGSLIAATKPRTKQLVTAITSKRRVTLVDLVSLRSLGSPGFLAAVFDVFARDKISIDVVATSEVSVSLTLDKRQTLSKHALDRLRQIAQVDIRRDKAIVSFVADDARSTNLIATCFSVLSQEEVNVQMISQGASKVNVAIVVNDDQAELVVRLLHSCFFPDRSPQVE